MGSMSERRALAARLEQDARISPRAYRMRVAALALAGFGVLALTLVAAFGVSVGLIVTLIAISPLLLLKLVKLVWIPLMLGWMVLKSLWVRFSPPQGHRLQPGEAPALVAEIERIRQAASAPVLHGIYLDGELNAAAATVPRALGLFGHRRYLVLGVPLMQVLDTEQFAAVVAHEFGHFGGRHARFNGWIYHLRQSWFRLLDALRAQHSWFSRAFTRFFEWYAPYFNAYSFALARQQELEADAIAARIAGAATTGHALASISLAGGILHGRFWPGIDEALRSGAPLPTALYRDMADCLRAPHDDRSTFAERALSQATDPDDTHPALTVRLASLGVTDITLGPGATSAAQVLLGDLLPTLEAELSEQWRMGIAPVWEEKQARFATDSARLAELQAKPSPDADEIGELARLLDDLHTSDEAIPMFRRAAEAKPDDAYVHARLGVLLLERDDADGVAHIRRALELEPEARGALLPVIDAFYARTGADDALREGIEKEARRHRRSAEALAHTRSVVSGDHLLPHGLDEAAVAAVREALDGIGKVGKAWLVRRDLEGASSVPHFTLLVSWRGMLLGSEQGYLRKIADAVPLPGTYVVCTAANRRWIARKIRKAAGAPLYHRR